MNTGGRRDSCLLFYVMGRGTAGWRQLHMNGRTGRMFQDKCGRTCREVRQERLRITEGPVGKYGRNRLRSTDGPVRKYGRNGWEVGKDLPGKYTGKADKYGIR